jgi:HD-like signal output (HDOD) protein
MANRVPVTLLSKLSPANRLSPSGMQALSEKVLISQIKSGQSLSAQNLSQWYIYLVKGSMQLKANGAAATTLEAGTASSFEPIFKDGQSEARIMAQTDCHILRFEKRILQNVLNDDNSVGLEVDEVSVNEMESELFKQVIEAYQKGTLELPTMPEVAMKIARIADDPDAGIPDIVKIVQVEPAVSGSLIKAANSPLYRGSSPVNNIKNSIVRLGLKTTRSLATSIALRKTFEIKSPNIKHAIHSLWEHSVNISALSFVIAKRQKGCDPERALMAGLLHDIGAIPILKYVGNNNLLLDQAELEATIAKLRAMIGVVVLNFWELDSELVTVVEEAEKWDRDDGPQPDLCDIVLVAHLCNNQLNACNKDMPALDSVPAYRKLDLGPQREDEKVQILSEAEAEISHIKQLL